MSNENKDTFDFKAIAGYATAFLIFMSSIRMVAKNQNVGLPILNYVSFSNVIMYVLDVTYGLNFFIICIFILLVGRKFINSKIEALFLNKSKKERIKIYNEILLSWG